MASSRPAKQHPLAAARAAATEGDFATALAHLLDAWRATPAIALADAIDAIGVRAERGLMPPSGRTPKERAAAWTAAATSGDPVIRGLLVTSLTDTKGNAETLARLMLVDQCDDPRLASAIVAMLEVPPYNVTVHRTQPFWKHVLARLPELGDARILARARACPPRWAANKTLNPPEVEMLGKKLAKLVPALEAAYGDPPELASTDADHLRAIVDAARATDGGADQAQALLAAIYANPADDAPRLVYADWLGERGDPRGELIALQLTADPTPAMRRRAAALVDEHATRWLGAIAPQLRKAGMRFERGFLAACKVGIRRDAAPDPIWSTLVEVTGGIPDAGPGGLPALRVATELDNGGLEILLAMKPRPRLEMLGWVASFDPRDLVEAIPLLQQLDIPTLRRLELRGFAPRDDERAPAFAAPAWCDLPITELAVTGEPDTLQEWIAAVRGSKLTGFEIIESTWNELDWRFGVTRASPATAFDGLVVVGPPTAKPPRLAQFALEVGRVLEGFAADTLTSIRIALPKRDAWKRVDAGLRDRITRALAYQPRATPVLDHL